MVFLQDAQFMNSSSELKLGQASTDEEGMAALTFVPRSEGDILILAEFLGTAEHAGAVDEATVHIQTGPPQYIEEAGISVPGINVSLLVAILGAVWGTYFLVMLRIYLIARGDPPAAESGGDL